MSKCNRVRFYKILISILFLPCFLSACNIIPGEESDDELSTSVAKTIESNALQYTLQAQQAQLTSMVETLAAQQQPPQQSIPTRLPHQPTPQVTSPSQNPSEANPQAVSSILTPLGINATPSLVFGPNNGSLIHDPSDGSISYECASINVQNFLAQVNFNAPYLGNIGDWDFGVLFRVQAKGNYRLAMFIGQQWELENSREDTKDLVPIAKGNLYSLKTNEGEANLVQVIGMTGQGWLLVNGVEAAKFDLSAMLDSGDICIALGFYKNTEIAGKETSYSAFTVWELR